MMLEGKNIPKYKFLQIERYKSLDTRQEFRTAHSEERCV
jgi:hypothetical protein